MPATITTEELDAYNVRLRQHGAEAVRLSKRRDAARDAIYASKGFIAHRFASARFAIAQERCDSAFNMRVWGFDSGREARRQALGQHLKHLRAQIASARGERTQAAVYAMAAE